MYHQMSIVGITKKHLDKVQRHDKIKKEYCKKNNIPLIEIPYVDYDKIDVDYIRRVIKL